MEYSLEVTDLALTMLSELIEDSNKLHRSMHLAIIRKIEEGLIDSNYGPEDAAALIAQGCLDQLLNHIKAS